MMDGWNARISFLLMNERSLAAFLVEIHLEVERLTHLAAQGGQRAREHLELALHLQRIVAYHLRRWDRNAIARFEAEYSLARLFVMGGLRAEAQDLACETLSDDPPEPYEHIFARLGQTGLLPPIDDTRTFGLAPVFDLPDIRQGMLLVEATQRAVITVASQDYNGARLLGDIETAHAYLIHALAIQEALRRYWSAVDASSPRTLRCARNSCVFLTRLGRTSEAKELAKRVIERPMSADLEEFFRSVIRAD